VHFDIHKMPNGLNKKTFYRMIIES